MSPGLGEVEASHTGLIWMNNFIPYSSLQLPFVWPYSQPESSQGLSLQSLGQGPEVTWAGGLGSHHTALCPVLLWVGVSVCSSSCLGSSEALWVSYLLWRSGQSCLALPSYTGSDLVSCWMEWRPRKTPAGGVRCFQRWLSALTQGWTGLSRARKGRTGRDDNLQRSGQDGKPMSVCFLCKGMRKVPALETRRLWCD